MTAHYLYRCYSEDGRLLYVGQTKDWRQRLDTHYRGAFWAGDIDRTTVKVHRTKDAALAAEKRAIRTEHPRFNYQGRWAVRSLWTQDAWIDYVRAAGAGFSTAWQRKHLETVFAAYAASFGELHPLAEVTRADWAARDAASAAQAKVRRAQHDAQQEVFRADERRVMYTHFLECDVCAKLGDWSADCPEILADLAASEADAS